MPRTLRLKSKKGEHTENVAKKQRQYERKIGKTIFEIVVEETEMAKETAESKIKRLIDNDVDRLILDEKRRTDNQNATV